MSTEPPSPTPLPHPPQLTLLSGRPPGGLWSLPSWREGLFEVQDAGSQRIAEAVEAKPGERVLDLCAGNGGKTLGARGGARGGAR